MWKLNKSGLRTQPWGVPVLRMMLDEMRPPSLMCCGLLERKF